MTARAIHASFAAWDETIEKDAATMAKPARYAVQIGAVDGEGVPEPR